MEASYRIVVPLLIALVCLVLMLVFKDELVTLVVDFDKSR